MKLPGGSPNLSRIHFIADSGKRRRKEEEETRFVSKSEGQWRSVSKWEGPTLSTKTSKGWALDLRRGRAVIPSGRSSLFWRGRRSDGRCSRDKWLGTLHSP